MIDKIGELADETGLVMLGITRPGQYVSHLIERLGIDQETAQEITEEVNNRILFPIRDSLRKIQEEREELAETIPERSLCQLAKSAPPLGEPPIIREKPAPEMPSLALETATLIPPPLTLPETPMPEFIPPPASPTGLPAAEAGAPPIPPNLPIGEEPAIFQAKTKEEIFRLPLQTVEKTPDLPSGEAKKIDPYKEQIS